MPQLHLQKLEEYEADHGHLRKNLETIYTQLNLIAKNLDKVGAKEEPAFAGPRTKIKQLIWQVVALNDAVVKLNLSDQIIHNRLWGLQNAIMIGAYSRVIVDIHMRSELVESCTIFFRNMAIRIVDIIACEEFPDKAQEWFEQAWEKAWNKPWKEWIEENSS